MKSINLCSVVCLVLLLLLHTKTGAQTWTGSGTSWNDPASWNPGLPSNGSTIIIDGLIATVDVASSFTAGNINIINGGELVIINTLDMTSDEIITITGSGSRLTVDAGGLLTAEFITSTDGGAIKITGGELDVADQLSMTNGTFDMTGGLLDYNGGVDEELYLENSTFTMTGGTLEFDRSIQVAGGSFTMEEGATMTATSTSRNLEFYDATADLGGTINNSGGDLSLFSTSVVNLLPTLLMDLDDLVMNDDGASSTLNIYGTVVAFDDLKFDETPPDDFVGDNDKIIVKDGGNLDIQGTFRDITDAESGNSIHVEDGGTLSIAILDNGQDPADVYGPGNFITSDQGATVTVEGETGLPVKLVYFKGNAVENGTLIEWVTALEINNDYFEVLKSIDGRSFSSIGRIKGNGNSNSAIVYTFLDRSVGSKVTFYQLKQVDFNGEFEFHPIIKVDSGLSAQRELTIYPNPISDDRFKISSGVSVGQPILLINTLTGKTILRRNLEADRTEWSLDLSDLNVSFGAYLIKLVDGHSNQMIGTLKVSIGK